MRSAGAFAAIESSKGKIPISPEELKDMIVTNAKIIANQADSDTRTFLRMLSGVMRDLRSADAAARRSCFTEGFYADNLEREVQQVAAAAAETYSVVYAFDLNRRIENMSGEAQGGGIASEARDRLEPISDLVDETNGVLIQDALGHLDQAMNELGDANTNYYILGFQPNADALAHRESYERVKITTTRGRDCQHAHWLPARRRRRQWRTGDGRSTRRLPRRSASRDCASTTRRTSVKPRSSRSIAWSSVSKANCPSAAARTRNLPTSCSSSVTVTQDKSPRAGPTKSCCPMPRRPAPPQGAPCGTCSSRSRQAIT